MTSIYNTGTITVTNGNAVVTGSGTAWAVALVTGGMFTSAGMAVPIASVTDDTHLVLDYNWPGTTAAGALYSIALENAAAASVVDLNTTLSRVLVTLSLAGITPDLSGTLTDRAALSLAMGDKGYLFLHAEIGVAFAFYRWNGTAWEGPFPVANAVATGGVSSLVAGSNVTIDNTNPAIPVINATGVPMETAIHSATGKTTPVDADELGIADSAASFGLKKLTWADTKAGVLAYFNGTAKATPIDADRVWVGDSTASNVPKWTTLTQFKAYLKTYFDTLYVSVGLARREVLTANRTYYVRTDGSNSNNGLANTSGGAFLTLQKAIDTVSALDISIYSVTIQAADGTYTGAVAVNGAWIGSGNVTLQGNVSTPANCIISTTSADCASVSNAGRLIVNGFKLQTTTAGSCLSTGTQSGSIQFSNVVFGATATHHIFCNKCGFIESTGSYTIAGGASSHINCVNGSTAILGAGTTVTLTGTPAFTTTINSQRAALVQCNSVTFSGSATGVRYNVDSNSVIFTAGAGASFVPGATAGSTSTGGQYA